MKEIFHRTSIRRYLDKEIEEEKIELLLKAAMQAPSAANQQPWEFTVVTNKDVLKELAKVSPYAGMLEGAAAGIAVLARKDCRIPGYAYIDNYTASQPVLGALFDDYQWHAKPLAALSSEIGISYTLMNDNKLELNYKWDYHSSGHSGYWRFDHAMHTLQFNFHFNLKHKNHYEKHQD